MKKFWRFLVIFPWTLLLILVAVLLEVLPGDFQGTVVDYTMILFAFIVLVAEVAKSADIKISRFITDMLTAVLALIIATALLTYYITVSGKTPAFYHWVIVGVITVDAILSPTISFRTALRNMEVGGGF